MRAQDLFMGDSFMQGLGIDDTIPVHVRRYFHDALHRDVCVINAGASARNNVRYYDATDDLKVEFGAAPERYYIPNDMHFNERGLRAYSDAVAKYLSTAIPGD